MEVATATGSGDGESGLKQRRPSTTTTSSSTSNDSDSSAEKSGRDNSNTLVQAQQPDNDNDNDADDDADAEQQQQQPQQGQATADTRPLFPCFFGRFDADRVREIVDWRSQRQLPAQDQLHEHVVVLTNRQGGRCYIVGTAHISQASVDVVEQLIEQVRPDTVMLELCNARRALALASPNEKRVAPTMSDLVAAVREGQGSNVLYMLLAMSVSSMTQQLDTPLGAEQQAAAQAALKRGCLMVLGDRPIDITLKRAWAALSLWEKLKLIGLVTYALVTGQRVSAEEVEQIKNSDIMTEMMAEMAKSFPAALKTIVHERDSYLTACLQWCPGDVVVGVVGLGHLKGIQEHWEDEKIDLKELEQVSQAGASIRTVVLSVVGVTLVTVSVLGYGAFTAVRWLLW